MRVKTYFTHIDRKLFNSQDNLHCILPISVGQRYHEDSKFESTLDLMNRSFKKCTILVCDTLQRYSLFAVANDKTFEEITSYSLQAGDEWIKRNQDFINNLTIPYEIQRWNSWLDHDEFDNYKLCIEDLYLSDADFNKEINDAVEKYISRLSTRNNNADLEKAREMSIQYLKEESAIFYLAMKTDNSNYFIYPTRMDFVTTLFRRLERDNLLHPCHFNGLNFRKLKSVS